VQIKELVGICKEYVIALRCELKRKELKEDDMARAAELAAYFTHCNLQVCSPVWLRGGGWSAGG
jgi:coatomer protein complex subunit alpha (xenin)